MASKEVEFQPGKPKRSGLAGKWDDTKLYLYNKEEGTVFGRTCRSWGKIGIFYLIYYSCLAAFFAICLQVFFTTLDDVEPRLSGMESLLKGNPGMGFRPRPKIESTLIKFDMDDPETFEDYTENIQDYIDKYLDDDYIDATGDCGDKGQHKADVESKGQACRFDVNALGGDCSAGNQYGYGNGQPCVLLKLNKIYGWDPETFTKQSIMENNSHAEAARKALGDNFDPNFIGMTCEGENAGDVDHIGEVEFFPKFGIPTWFFPFVNTKHYLPPFVFAKFRNPREGALVQIWCKAWTKNIYHHKNDKAGSIHMELLMD